MGALKHQQGPRAPLTQPDPRREMDWHSAGVVRYKNPSLACSQFEHFKVGESFEGSIARVLEVNRRFATADATDDGAIQIGIRKEADAHNPDFRNSSRAR